MSVHMPQKSVTRYFIPLIDVLLLLFVIFLLMPVADETKVDKILNENSDLVGELESRDSEMDRTNNDLKQATAKLQQYEKDKDNLDKIKDLRDQIKSLEDELARAKDLRQSAAFFVIDVDQTGKISYFDRGKPLPIVDEKIAQKLIDRHKLENENRELYYYFHFPRPRPEGIPTSGQEKNYRKWFEGVANSLNEI